MNKANRHTFVFQFVCVIEQFAFEDNSELFRRDSFLFLKNELDLLHCGILIDVDLVFVAIQGFDVDKHGG